MFSYNVVDRLRWATNFVPVPVDIKRTKFLTCNTKIAFEDGNMNVFDCSLSISVMVLSR